MCDFKPGDEVVCVDASPGVNHHDLVEGAVYRVRAVSDRWREPSVWVGCYNEWGGQHWHYARRFRKVQRKTTDLSIEAFLTIKPGQFEEPKRTADPVKKREKAQ